ncbi:MAG: ABC transporter substrate-binding protein [Oscillospiraceae bacterium]|nr:ABC transporter substrate-binding protein [Oscillospiraceae bacterium]
MNSMKKIMALLLVLVFMVGVFAGCSSSSDSSSTTESETTTETEETEEAAETEETADVGEIVIGWLGPQTGNVAQYGLAVMNGVDLYVEQLNAAGGINGKTVRVVYYDEEGDTTKAITGYNYLLDQGAVAIIGDVTTAPCTAVVVESQADNTPMITASATATSITYDEESDTVYSNMFRSCFIDPFQGTTMADFAAEELGATTAAVLYDNGDTYSTGVYEYFVAECEALGIEIVADESYASGSVDFSSQLANIAAADPDVIFLPVYYNDVALIVTQAASAGITATYLGVDGWSSTVDTIDDPTLLNGAYYCSGYSAEDTSELVQQFLADYEAEYGEVPGMFAAQGYDAAWILCDAIAVAEADGVEYGTAEYSQAIIDAMSATDSDYVTGHVTYDEYNNPQKTAAIITFTDGTESFWGSYGG